MTRKTITIIALCALAAMGISNANAYQTTTEQPRVVNGEKENTIKGLNIDKFPVKDVTNQIYAQTGSRLGGALISSWVDLLRRAGYDVSAYQVGKKNCFAKLTGRQYILDLGAVTVQRHFVTPFKPDIKNSPQNNAPTDIKNIPAGMQTNLTDLFCAVYAYEYLAQAIQINNQSNVGYAPLCEVLQGNSCDLANDQKVSEIVHQKATAPICPPGIPNC